MGMYSERKVLKPASDKTSAWPPSRERPGEGDGLRKEVSICLGYVSFISYIPYSRVARNLIPFLQYTYMTATKKFLPLQLLRTTSSSFCAKSVIMLLAKMSSKIWSTRMRGYCPSLPANICTRVIFRACRNSRTSVILLISFTKCTRSIHNR